MKSVSNANQVEKRRIDVLVEPTVVKEDMPALVVVLEHPLECFDGLWRDARQTGCSGKVGRRSRCREQKVKFRGHVAPNGASWRWRIYTGRVPSEEPMMSTC